MGTSQFKKILFVPISSQYIDLNIFATNYYWQISKLLYPLKLNWIMIIIGFHFISHFNNFNRFKSWLTPRITLTNLWRKILQHKWWASVFTTSEGEMVFLKCTIFRFLEFEMIRHSFLNIGENIKETKLITLTIQKNLQSYNWINGGNCLQVPLR